VGDITLSVILLYRMMRIVFKTFAISTHAWLESCTPSIDASIT